jgi:hypothetical protein
MNLKSILRTIVGTVAKGTPVGQALGILGNLREQAAAIKPNQFYVIVDPRRHKVVAHIKGTRKFIIYQLKREAVAVNKAYFKGMEYEVIRVELVEANAYNELFSFIS